MTADGPHVGQRIATYRRARRMTQVDLARSSFVSLAMIRAIERGARSPSDETLDSIASALAVDPSRLVATAGGRASTHILAALPEISAVIAPYDIPMGPPSRSGREQADAVRQAVERRLSSQYKRLALAAPGLLDDGIRAFHASHEGERQTAVRQLVAVTRAVDAVAFKSGAHDLSARLIELMRWACAQVEDPLLAATVAYVRTEIFFVAKAHLAGLRALEIAVDASPSPVDRGTAAARGALHMRAAVIAGRTGNVAAADMHLKEALHLSDLTPEGIYDGTAFGPSSVRIHQVSVAVSLGPDHVSRALAVAEEWKPPRELPAERRSGFYIELARAQLWAGRPEHAFESLKVARATAPQHTREHRWAREDVATLRRLKRSSADELTSFAEWIGAV
ncbi:helix-turn-helix domain-containing protein [Streptomyces liangshanensis]|uniref:helix-turn-helix domain-containing protein n=1 Tax=Streptomyces liangshanensis TaxID=2717324 RepID=UPI0036DB7F43